MSYMARQIQAFRFWIQGYPSFYEPIVKEYMRIIGYQIIRSPAQVTSLDSQRLITRLFDGTQLIGPEIDDKKLQLILNKRKRLQPDALLYKQGN